MDKTSVERKAILYGTLIWSSISILGCCFFLKKYYSQGIENVYYVYYDDLNTWQHIYWILVAVVVAVFLIHGFLQIIVKSILYKGRERAILLHTLPFFIVFVAGMCLKRYTNTCFMDFYMGDERNIWDIAVALNPFIFVYMSELYLTTFFVVPVIIAPTIVKDTLCAFILGYTVYNIRDYYSSKIAYAIYILFIALQPIWKFGYSVHRMHWYGYLYLYFAVKLFFDSRDRKRDYTFVTVLGMTLLTALLTVLRREGLYLFIFGIILLIMVYGRTGGRFDRKRITKISVMFVLCQTLLYTPVAIQGFGESTITYRAYLVHILAMESLDREAISEELKVVDQYMDISIIDKMNADYGDSHWPDVSDYDYVTGKYFAIRENPTVSEENFSDAVISIVKKQPIPFLESRILAFVATSSGIANNLFIPLTFTIIILVLAIAKRDWVLFVLAFGVCCHTGITTLTMPASYFKYFFEMYLFGYIMAVIMIADFVSKKRKA